eukprot:759234-Hanusia_phi.AAC.1
MEGEEEDPGMEEEEEEEGEEEEEVRNLESALIVMCEGSKKQRVWNMLREKQVNGDILLLLLLLLPPPPPPPPPPTSSGVIPNTLTAPSQTPP